MCVTQCGVVLPRTKSPKRWFVSVLYSMCKILRRRKGSKNTFGGRAYGVTSPVPWLMVTVSPTDTYTTSWHAGAGGLCQWHWRPGAAQRIPGHVTFFENWFNQGTRLESPARALKVMTVTRSDPPGLLKQEFHSEECQLLKHKIMFHSFLQASNHMYR